MQYARSDLLNYDQMKLMCTSCLPNQKAQLIANVLKKYAMIFQDNVYKLSREIIYERSDTQSIKDTLVTMTTLLLEQSFLNLSTAEQDNIQANKAYKSTMSHTGVQHYIAELTEKMCDPSIQLNRNEAGIIHFRNGAYNMKEKTLSPRIQGHHFITHYINRNYQPSTHATRDKLMKVISQIYPVEEDRIVVLSHIGRALSGYVENDQANLFLLGKGSAGKSLIMKLTKKAIGVYCEELQCDLFEKGNKNLDKTLNEFDINKMIRIAWVNELSDKRMNESLFKTFCEGLVKTSKLYQDGSHTVEIHSKLICTSNAMPNILIDSGSSRRLIAYEHVSEFVDDQNKVDHSKNIYKKDKSLLDKLDSEMLNAWFDILVSYCVEWMDGKAPKETESFNNAKAAITSSNDIFKDFIDAKIEQTKSTDDRIGKTEMHESFHEMYPTKHLSVQQIISALKDKGIEYSPKFRHLNIQGCFYCVKFSSDADQEQRKVTVSQDKLREAFDTIEKQKQEIEGLKKQMARKAIVPKNVYKSIKTKPSPEDQQIMRQIELAQLMQRSLELDKQIDLQVKQAHELMAKIDKLIQQKHQPAFNSFVISTTNDAMKLFITL